MMENRDLMTVLDENEDYTLYRMQNDIFDTAVMVYHEGRPDEENLVLTDMQGPFPKTLEDAVDFEWVRAEEVDW